MTLLPVDELRRRIKEKEARFEPNRKVIVAVIRSVNGSVHPANREDMVWVDEFGLGFNYAAVYNDVVVPVADLPVLVGASPKPPYRRSVIGTYAGDVDPVQESDTGAHHSPPHAKNHQYPAEDNKGEDAVLVFQPAIQPFKLTGDGASLTVSLRGMIFMVNGQRRTFQGGTVDLTSYVPGTSSRAVRVLVYLDTSTNTIEVEEGTEVADSVGVPTPYPTCPAGGIPSAYVRLANGQTAVTTSTDVDDARFLLYARGGEENPFVPSAAGQVVYSPAGSAFGAYLPLTGSNGWMVNDNGVLLVVG